MNKILKFLLVAFATVFTFFAFYTYYNSHFSEIAKTGQANLANIKRVKLQMTEKETLVIMGRPAMIDTSKENYVVYKYPTNDDSYAYIDICFDSSMVVKEIYAP